MRSHFKSKFIFSVNSLSFQRIWGSCVFAPLKRCPPHHFPRKHLICDRGSIWKTPLLWSSEEVGCNRWNFLKRRRVKIGVTKKWVLLFFGLSVPLEAVCNIASLHLVGYCVRSGCDDSANKRKGVADLNGISYQVTWCQVTWNFVSVVLFKSISQLHSIANTCTYHHELMCVVCGLFTTCDLRRLNKQSRQLNKFASPDRLLWRCRSFPYFYPFESLKMEWVDNLTHKPV